MGEVTITADEYRELVLKAYRYDKLREYCLASRYVTTEENILFDITDEEKKKMKEGSNN